MIVDMTRGVFRRIYSSATRDRRINQLSVNAELLYWRLHCVADDFGAFEADPYLLLCSALPLRRDVDQQQITAALDELVRAELIQLYRVAGEKFGHICGFTEAQPANKAGRRIRRYPPAESATGQNDVGGDSCNLGKFVQPEQSSLHQSENQSENENYSQSVSENQTHTRPVAVLGVCDEDASQDQRNTGPEAPASPAIAAIYDAYPRHVGRSEALAAIRKALDAIEQRCDETDASAWLLERTRAFAASPAGKAGRFCPHPASWFNAGRYDDDPNEWKAAAQTAPTLRLACGSSGENASSRPTTRDLPAGPTSKWGLIGQLQVKIATLPNDPRVPQWRAEIEQLKEDSGSSV